MLKNSQEEENKEEFCVACLAGLAALSGVGTSQGANSIQDKKKKNYVFYTGVAVSVISLIVLIYMLCFKNCDECK